MSVWAVIVAAGSGERFGGDIPKQYLPLAGRRVIDFSLDAARATCDGVVLVVSEARAGEAEPLADVVVTGGSTRSGSVRAGLAMVPGDATIVVVHDAARPLAGSELFGAVIEAVRAGAEGAVPAVSVADTIKRARDGVIVETLDRSELVAVQTPQAFDAAVLRAAHAANGEATDDAALIEAAGGRVVTVPGDVQNAKLTLAGDLPTAERLLAGRNDRDARQ